MPSAEPTSRLSIVVSFRERWSLTLRTLKSIVEHSRQPYLLYLLDIGMPETLRQRIDELMAELGQPIEVVKSDCFWPTQARAELVPRLDTQYAVFIDNDVLVKPGWDEALIRCADETGAGIVGPLYLWGHDENADVIHMAGGELQIHDEEGGKVIEEWHRLLNKPLNELQVPLVRETCGFAEFHCLLMRREVFQAPDIFHAEIVNVHEHIHASLIARELGYETWMEPESRVLYLSHSSWVMGETTLARTRWSKDAAAHSLHHFAQRWNVINDGRSFAGVWHFLANHHDAINPLRVTKQTIANAPLKITRADLLQSPGQLLNLAFQRGYDERDQRKLARACEVAMRLCDGIYRPCGRPFINHLIGTASILLHYGFVPRLVMAGLLHASLSHANPQSDKSYDAAEMLKNMANSQLEDIVLSYGKRYERYREILKHPVRIGLMKVEDIELLLLEVANLIDMYLSLEIMLTQRGDLPDEKLFELMALACDKVGLTGMGATLKEARKTLSKRPALEFNAQSESFVFTMDGAKSVSTS